MALARDLVKFSKLCNIFDISNVSKAGCLQNPSSTISVRTAKHYDPKFKWLRSKKFIPIELPHTEKAKERKKNIFRDMKIFPRYWKTRPLTITTATDVFDPYVPQEGDGKATLLSKGVLNLATAPKSKIADITAMRKIKNFDADFKRDIFLQEAQDVYVNAHKVLMKQDSEELSEFVTEKAVGEMMAGLKNKTIRWKFIKSLEAPVLLRARAEEVVVETNLFAQITVRFHTKQVLAIYDRFGRLEHGNEFIPKDVLEYVVFEKHINNEYGKWRLHAKIIPEWSQTLLSNTRTYRIKEVEEEEEDEEDLFPEERDPEPEHKSTAELLPAENKAEKQVT